jgi:DNA (cytosine-5)-methyltransferase 1
MERAGFRCLAAIDFNQEAITTFEANFPEDIVALRKDLTTFTPGKLVAKIGVNSVDVIVGGPPCQGFSHVRQVDSANHGARVRRDKRRYLFRAFLDYVDAFRPRVFVMENVLGIQSAAKGKFFTLVQAEARALGYRVHTQVEEAWKLGVPQKRRRQLVIGTRNDVPGYISGELRPAARAGAHLEPKLWDVIGDLPPLAAGTGCEVRDYDLTRRAAHLAHRGKSARHYLEAVLEISDAANLTAHRARPHNDQDLRDFARVREGEHSGQAERRGERMEFTYKRTCFEDRYKRQHRERLCSTIVAHLSKDGLGFIHPTQSRSLTPREAARIQSFPDWFTFPVSRTHQFRLIGNAVPPLVAEAVGDELRAILAAADRECASKQCIFATRDVELPAHSDFPTDARDAVQRLLPLSRATRRQLRTMPGVDFRRGWHALIWLYPNLHPDNALDHGRDVVETTAPAPEAFDWRERYERSGWPVALELIGREAWRRYKAGALSEPDFYCVDAQREGLREWRHA